MLDMVPGYFKVIRHVRPKLSCGHCSRVVQQPAPPRPIARGMAAPGLLAQIIVAKYADQCPLYRQQGIYLRQLFQSLPSAKSVDDYEALLPWNITRSR